MEDNQPSIEDQENSSIDTYARLSAGAYGGKDVDGFNIDHELSNDDYTTYHNPKTNKAYVSFRGTDLHGKNKFRDIGADALLALGLQEASNRFKKARRVTDKAIEKYGRENTSTVGTSLGGAQSLYTGAKRGIPAHSFNGGVNLTDVIRSKGVFNHGILKPFLGKLNFDKNIHHNYVTKNDVVSHLGKYVKGINTHFVPQKHKNPHSLKNFF